MFLYLAHTKLDAFQISRKFTLECYKLTRAFPPDERYVLGQQVRRAALSVHLNLAEGSSRHSEPDRKRFYEMSRSSVVEIDTCFDLAINLEYYKLEDLQEFGALLVSTFKLLSGLIDK